MTKEYRSKLTLDSIVPFMGKTKRRGQETIGDCPLCGKKGHLYAHQAQDKLLVYCQKCNGRGEDIIKAFVNMGAKGEEIREVERRDHHYKNPDGSLAFQKFGAKYSDGHKEFKFGVSEDGISVEYKKPEGSISLYNLPALEAATGQETLYIVEGEKKVDAMAERGFLATCSCYGAKENVKLTATERELLEKFPVKVVIPDNDEAGEKYIKAWPDANVLLMTDFWPECPNRGDVADYFQQGGDPEKIREHRFEPPLALDSEFFENLHEYGDIVTKANFEALYRIQEPLDREMALGRFAEAAKKAGCKRDFDRCWRTFQMEKARALGPERGGNKSKVANQPLEIFTGPWELNNKGITKTQMDMNGNPKAEVICHTPIMPVELLNNIELGTQKVRVMYSKEGLWHGTTVARDVLASNNKIVMLANYGVAVDSNNAKHLVGFMTDAIAMNENDVLTKKDSVSHFGWAKNRTVFVPYSEELVLDNSLENESLVSSIAEKGTLEEWVEYIKPLRKAIPVRIMLCASFGSVLLERLGLLPFIVHLWGGTGNGKSVSLMVAASVWGNPESAKLVRSMNMTTNSMMTTVALLHNIPFFGDEMQSIKQRGISYDTLVMRICEGIDRGRLSSSAQMQEQKSWKNACIFNGEEPITQSNSGGGVQNRVIEVEAPEKIIEDGHAVSEFVRQHYGTAGRDFIENLPPDEELKAMYKRYYRDVLERGHTTEKQAMAMGVIAMTDELTSGMIFKDYQADPLLLYQYCKSTTEVDPSERAYQMIVDWVAENIVKFSEAKDKATAMYGKFNGSTCQIIKTVLERTLKEFGFDFNAVKKPWAEKGYLSKPQKGKKQYFRYGSICGTPVAVVDLKLSNNEEKN